MPILPIRVESADGVARAFGPSSPGLDDECLKKRRRASMNHFRTFSPPAPGLAVRVGDQTRQPVVSDQKPATTFLLGVGCQKGGTTWLSDYLRKHPEADMGFRKEYHVLDAMHLPSCRMYVEAETACGRQMLDWFSRPKRNPAECTLLDFYADVDNYYDYFRHLATRQTRVRLVGDMTPSYAGLPADAFASVRRSLEDRGLTVKVIFLMRDPVDRVWSAVRMGRRQGLLAGKSDAAWVRKLFRTPEFEFRTRYDETIRNLDAVFSTEQVHFQFYETLFSAEKIRAITDFLGLRFIEPETDIRSNVSPKTEALPVDAQKAIAEFYGPVYEFCAARFGDNLIRRLWPSYGFLAANRAPMAA